MRLGSSFKKWMQIEEKDIKFLEHPEAHKKWVLKDSKNNIVFVGNIYQACKHAKLFSFNIYET